MDEIAREHIGDDQRVSRHLYLSMYDENQALMWEKGGIFSFPTDGNQCDSVVWRKYADSAAEVHALACHVNDRRRLNYCGFITAGVGEVRTIKARNHSLEVNHEPSEGPHHAEICVRPRGKLDKNTKAAIRMGLSRLFSAQESHRCQ